jgi:hypothetical protein
VPEFAAAMRELEAGLHRITLIVSEDMLKRETTPHRPGNPAFHRLLVLYATTGQLMIDLLGFMPADSFARILHYTTRKDIHI